MKRKQDTSNSVSREICKEIRDSQGEYKTEHQLGFIRRKCYRNVVNGVAKRNLFASVGFNDIIAPYFLQICHKYRVHRRDPPVIEYRIFKDVNRLNLMFNVHVTARFTNHVPMWTTSYLIARSILCTESYHLYFVYK